MIIITGFFLKFGHADRQSKWNHQLSIPSGDGGFLSVPVHYGDWVPITKAKQTIEAVASKIEAAVSPVRRKDPLPPPEIITAPDPPEDRFVKPKNKFKESKDPNLSILEYRVCFIEMFI